MKIITIIIIILVVIGSALALNLESKGAYRLWKYAEDHVAVQRVIKDVEDVNHVVWERVYDLREAQINRATAQAEYRFWDMNDVEAIAYVVGKKAVAEAKVARWDVIVNKFATAIDKE